MSEYDQFLGGKRQIGGNHGFDPVYMPDWLFQFQAHLTEWALRHGRSLLLEDCGLGKTPQQLVWAQNVVQHTNRNVLIATPLAVSYQTVREGEKFGIECHRSTGDLPPSAGIVVTNYEQLEHFDPADFAGMVCDESSILKNFSGVRKAQLTEFMRRLPYRLLCTATAAPNDYIELGTSSEALGQLGHMDMLSRFFKNDQNTATTRTMRFQGKAPAKWRFRGHAERPFWRWVCSWARALRKPSDFGFDDADFTLPPLHEVSHVIETKKLRPGMLIPLPAVGLAEQREERRVTLEDRCAKVAELVDHREQALVWCHLNAEGDLLEELIPDAVQVAGGHSDDVKEERLRAFADGSLRVLVTKPKIGAWGLNLQNCAHVTFFPSHSFEQYYQGVRRCWRFGQKREVTVDVVTTEGEADVLANLQRKALAADQMFERIVEHMTEELVIERGETYTNPVEVPAWL